jgi:hypothetical protein
MRVPQRKPGRLKRVSRKKIAIKEDLRRVQAVSLGRIGIDSEAETQMKSLLRDSKYNNMKSIIRMT